MFTLPQLSYPYDSLEPYLDARTMEIHHAKHHQTYVDKLNAALKDFPKFQNQKIEELLTKLDELPENIRTAVRNHGGGHFNHSLFWEILCPPKGHQVNGEISKFITRDFGGWNLFQNKFEEAALNQFGSGWAWLVVDKEKKLQIKALPNQDSPLSLKMTPILGIDVWEHAYYLKYQNKRIDYIKAWWNVVNWPAVEQKFMTA